MSAPISPGPAGASLRRWQRFTPAERVMRSAFYVVVLIAIVWSLRSIEIIPEFLYDAPEQMADLIRRMWPIEWSYYPGGTHDALIETLHIATLGTALHPSRHPGEALQHPIEEAGGVSLGGGRDPSW